MISPALLEVTLTASQGAVPVTVTVGDSDVLTVLDGVTVPVIDLVAVVDDEAPTLTVDVDVGDCVGDSEVDAETAKAAGMPFYFVTFGYAVGGTDRIQCHERVDDFWKFADRIKA